jgi:hypothetical protein
MTHTDKFGREWKFTPHHDTNRMLKVPTDVMERFIAADRLVAGPYHMRPYFQGQEVECYVLRLGFGGRASICTGARYGNDGPDYYSSLLDQEFMLQALLRHSRWNADLANLSALHEVFSDQMGKSRERA